MRNWTRVILGVAPCLIGIACARDDKASPHTDRDESGGGEVIGAEGGDSYVIYELEPHGEDTHAQEPEPTTEPLGRVHDVCPADIEGLGVRVSAVPRGGALVMTVPPDKMSDLRSRLNHFAEVHAESRGEHNEIQSHAPSGAHGGEEFIDEQAMIHRATSVRVVDIPRGARLEFRLEDGEQVRELRAELRKDAQMLRDGLCPLSITLAI
jgi:hypothetical protein